MSALSTVNLCYLHSLMNLNLELASDSGHSAILALIMHKDLQWKNQLLSSLPSGLKGRTIPVGCRLKISGDMQSQISIQREYLTTVRIATLIIFSVPLFSSNFLKFWKSSVYFGHRIAKHTKQFMGQGNCFPPPVWKCQVFLLSQCNASEMSVSVFLEPRLWLLLFDTWSFSLSKMYVHSVGTVSCCSLCNQSPMWLWSGLSRHCLLLWMAASIFAWEDIYLKELITPYV